MHSKISWYHEELEVALASREIQRLLRPAWIRGLEWLWLYFLGAMVH